MKIRTLFNVSALLLGLVGLSTAISMVWTTTLITRATSQLGEAVESVRAAQELENSLFDYERESGLAGSVGSPDATRSGEVRKWLERVQQHVSSDEERRIVQLVRQKVEAYLSAPPGADEELLASVLATADSLATLNVSEARAARQHAERIDNLANLWGIGSAVVLLTGIAIVVVGARTRLYRPLLTLRDEIAAYKRNKRGRIALDGPDELREIAAEFNAMAGTLEDQQESQLHFIAGVAHDLRNPLHTLNLTAAVLTRSGELPPDGQVARLLEAMSKQVGRLNRMVEDLMDRTRIEAGELNLQRECTDLVELAADVVELYRPTLDSHVLVLEARQGPVRVHCDPSRLVQVLTNLVSNAIKYSPDGGHIRIAVSQDSDSACVTVSDEGLGIPPGELESIFEPFKRSQATKSDIPGIGLGLSVSRRIVRAHGGDIDVQSALRGGSKFVVRLRRQTGEYGSTA